MSSASPRNILLVLLIVVGILLPIILIYIGYNVAVFRGKTLAAMVVRKISLTGIDCLISLNPNIIVLCTI